jgi:hypothetical protein
LVFIKISSFFFAFLSLLFFLVLIDIFSKVSFLVLIGSMIGMMIDRKLLLKFFLCYELFFFILSVIMLGSSCEINVMIILLFLLWNSTSEVVLGLSVLFTSKVFLNLKRISCYFTSIALTLNVSLVTLPRLP